MCREAAAIARSWGWNAGDISLARVMTHAEAASNRDDRWMHDNYGPVIWGGTGERWDFLQLSRNGPPTGGDQLRERIRRFLSEPELPGGAEPKPARLAFRSATTINTRYEIPYAWEASRRRILIGSLDVVPTFRGDQVQPSVGWPLFEMTLKSGNAPVILRGILRDNRAWCRVLEFAEEFGVSVSFEPFALFERRGG